MPGRMETAPGRAVGPISARAALGVASTVAVVVALLRALPDDAAALAAAGLLVLLAAAVAARPVLGAVGLCALPVTTIALSLLFRWDLGEEAVRRLGWWKEGIAAGLVAAAARRLVAGGSRLHPLDWLAVALVAVGLAYAASGYPRGFPDPSFADRLASVRTDLGPVVLVVALRHAGLSVAAVRLVHRVALGTAVVLAAAAMVEFVASDTWNAVAVEHVHVLQYRTQVLDVFKPTVTQVPDDIRVYGGAGDRRFFRLGSLEFDYLAFAFVSVLGVALAVERLVRRHPAAGSGAGILGRARARLLPGIGRPALPLALLGVALLLNQTRSAVAVAFLVALAASRALPGRDADSRAALRRSLRTILVVGLVAAFAVGLLDRLFSDPTSNSAHLDSTRLAVEVALDHPFGRGLATAAGAGQAAIGAAAVVPENQVLQLVVQLGWLPGLAYAALGAAAVVALHRRARAPAGDEPAAAATAGLAGLLAVGIVATPFTAVTVGWLTALVVGTALSERR